MTLELELSANFWSYFDMNGKEKKISNCLEETSLEFIPDSNWKHNSINVAVRFF